MTTSNAAPAPAPAPTPSSILIIGTGVFGLSTAYALATNPLYAGTRILVLDRVPFPAPDAASVDSSRIVRADYADDVYTLLMSEAQPEWLGEFGRDGRFAQTGLMLSIDDPEDQGGLGKRYMERSLENVREKLGLKVGALGEEGVDVTVLKGKEMLQSVMKGTGGEFGELGYVNWTSGWADAEGGIRYLRTLVEATGRVEFRIAEVDELLFDHASSVVRGVRTKQGEEITADLTVLATGAWTARFIDTRGICSASGQIIAYIDISAEETAALENNPTYLSETTGCFLIPPRDGVLKVARHGYGYANPVRMLHPEQPKGQQEEITASLPRTKLDDPHLSLPAEGDDELRRCLKRVVPRMGDRPWSQTRICWYCDTPSSDWLIDYHPKWKGLFVATGGSGHGYKFVPIIGRRIVDVMSGHDRDDLGKRLRQRWTWPAKRHEKDHIWTDDFRGGRKGMLLDEEFAKRG